MKKTQENLFFWIILYKKTKMKTFNFLQFFFFCLKKRNDNDTDSPP